MQHHQLRPTCATVDCVGCEGLQRSAAIIRLKKMPFLQPSLSGHGALQGMAVTFCHDIPHTLQALAVVHGKLGCAKGEGELHTHILKHSFNPTYLRTGHHYTQLLHLVLMWMDNFVIGFNRTLLTTTTFPFLFFFKGFRFNWFFPDLSSNSTIVISTDPNKAINE